MNWISVKERLPAITEGFLDCLVVVSQNRVVQARFNCKTHHFQSMQFEEIDTIVTHWMPLPAPPTSG